MYPLLWFGFTDLFLHIFIHKMCALKNDTMGENIFFFLRGRKTYSYMYPFTLVWVQWFIPSYFYTQNVCIKKWHNGRKHILFFERKENIFLYVSFYFGLGSLIHFLLLCIEMSLQWKETLQSISNSLISVPFPSFVSNISFPHQEFLPVFGNIFLYYMYPLLLCNCINSWWSRVCQKKIDGIIINWLDVLLDHGLFYPLLPSVDYMF
jgi:hypothetical protein